MNGKYFIIAGAIIIVVFILGFSAKGMLEKNPTQYATQATYTNLATNQPGNTPGNTATPSPGNANSGNTGNVQVAKLYVQGSSYVIEPSVFKKGVPVRLEADIARMPGCSKSVVIPQFNVRKTVSQNDNFIEFTPTQSGTIYIACSMNMYRGSFTVSDDGVAGSTATTQAQKQQPIIPASTGGSCGASGGGCGCGG